MILPNRPVAPARPGPGAVGLGRTQARIVWFAIAAFFAATLVAALVAASSVEGGPGAGLKDVGDLLVAVACVVVVADLAVGWLVARQIRRNASPEAPPESVAATQVIVGSATALSGGIVCAVFFFLTHQGLLLLLAVPCALVLLAWFPSEARWAALGPARAAGEPARRSMMRE